MIDDTTTLAHIGKIAGPLNVRNRASAIVIYWQLPVVSCHFLSVIPGLTRDPAFFSAAPWERAVGPRIKPVLSLVEGSGVTVTSISAIGRLPSSLAPLPK